MSSSSEYYVGLSSTTRLDVSSDNWWQIPGFFLGFRKFVQRAKSVSLQPKAVCPKRPKGRCLYVAAQPDGVLGVKGAATVIWRHLKRHLRCGRAKRQKRHQETKLQSCRVFLMCRKGVSVYRSSTDTNEQMAKHSKHEPGVPLVQSSKMTHESHYLPAA